MTCRGEFHSYYVNELGFGRCERCGASMPIHPPAKGVPLPSDVIAKLRALYEVGSIETLDGQRALDTLIDAIPALLDVAEAVQRVDPRCAGPSEEEWSEILKASGALAKVEVG